MISRPFRGGYEEMQILDLTNNHTLTTELRIQVVFRIKEASSSDCFFSNGIHILPPVQNTDLDGDMVRIAAAPIDWAVVIFNLPSVKACTTQTDGSFLEIAELRHIILFVHINFLQKISRSELNCPGR